MKVLAFGYGRQLFAPDNPERRRLEMCAEAAGGIDLIIFTHLTDGVSVTKTDSGLTLHPTNSRSKLTMLLDAYLIGRRLLISYGSTPTIITTQDPFETGLVGALLAFQFHTELTVQEHADVFSTPHWRSESIGNWIRYYGGVVLLKRATTIRVVATRIKQTLQTKFGIGNNITTLPVAIDVTPYQHAAPAPLVRSLFSQNTFVFLSVARFVPQKNLPLLLAAFKRVVTANPQARLLLVGKGPETAHLMQLLDRQYPTCTVTERPVQIITWSDDVPGLMAASDAYVLSSNYEGWGRVLIEAVCSQLPVVTTDVGCVGEVVQSEVHGLVVPVGDEEALAAAMTRLMVDTVQYNRIKQTLAQIEIDQLPGADSVHYGERWTQSLRAHL